MRRGLCRGRDVEEEKEERGLLMVVLRNRSGRGCRGMLIKDVHNLLAAVAGRRSSMMVVAVMNSRMDGR